MAYALSDFFLDPLLRAPTIGSMFMCAATAMIGVIVFASRRSLVGETLSHAAYPGLIFMGSIASLFFPYLNRGAFLLLLCGAFISSLGAYFFLEVLQKRWKVKKDAALCFVLSAFFGVGVLVASYLQKAKPLWHKSTLTFLYGQAATMTDFQMKLYAALFVLAALFIAYFYRTIQLMCFDGTFAKVRGISSRRFNLLFAGLLVLAVIVSMKSVGVILLSGMLIAPALGARQLSHNLSKMFVLAGGIGAFSAFTGTFLSVRFSELQLAGPASFPTGPVIVLTSSFLALMLLLFSPNQGRVIQYIQRRKQVKKCLLECLLKMLVRKKDGTSLKEVSTFFQGSILCARNVLSEGKSRGFVVQEEGLYALSLTGQEKAEALLQEGQV